MYELSKAGEKSYYINCPAKIGIYTAGDNEVYLIDSGNDKDAGRRVKKILEENHWHLKGILNTHSNADHIGGNRYLQSQTNCKIYAKGIEEDFTRHPILEPSFLYGGYPCRELRHKFLLAQECQTSPFTDEEFPQEIEVIPLPGHFFDMAGFRTPDQTVFLADCISSRETLDKYGIPFIYDVQAYLETLDKVEQMEAAVFVPSHAEVSKDIKELAGYNRDKVMEAALRLLDICRKPKCFEVILQEIFHQYDLSMNFEQYVLVGSTIRSYLAWLKDNGKLSIDLSNQMLLWETAS